MTYIRNTLLVVSAGIAIWILVFIILALWNRVQFEPDSPYDVTIQSDSTDHTYDYRWPLRSLNEEPYDVNHDGKVDIVDVSAVIGHTNPVPKLP